MLFGTGPTRSKVDDSRMNIQKCVVPNDYRLSWSHLWACLFATQATERERETGLDKRASCKCSAPSPVIYGPKMTGREFTKPCPSTHRKVVLPSSKAVSWPKKGRLKWRSYYEQICRPKSPALVVICSRRKSSSLPSLLPTNTIKNLHSIVSSSETSKKFIMYSWTILVEHNKSLKCDELCFIKNAFHDVVGDY